LSGPAEPRIDKARTAPGMVGKVVRARCERKTGRLCRPPRVVQTDQYHCWLRQTTSPYNAKSHCEPSHPPHGGQKKCGNRSARCGNLIRSRAENRSKSGGWRLVQPIPPMPNHVINDHHKTSRCYAREGTSEYRPQESAGQFNPVPVTYGRAKTMGSGRSRLLAVHQASLMSSQPAAFTTSAPFGPLLSWHRAVNQAGVVVTGSRFPTSLQRRDSHIRRMPDLLHLGRKWPSTSPARSPGRRREDSPAKRSARIPGQRLADVRGRSGAARRVAAW